MRDGVVKEGGRWQINDTGELPSDLVLEKLRVGKVKMAAGLMAVDIWRVGDVDGGEVWMPAIYEDKGGDGDGVNSISGEKRTELLSWLTNGWSMVAAVRLVFGGWNEKKFGSKEEVAKKRPKEVAMVAIAGPDNRGKSTVVARLGGEDGQHDAVNMDPFSVANQQTEDYRAEMVIKGVAGGESEEVLPLVEAVRGEGLGHLGPGSLNGLLCRLVNIVLHPERKEVLVLDMPGLQVRRESLEAPDLFYLYAVPYIWYEGGVGSSLEEMADNGLAWLKGQLPEKIEEFGEREEMFKAAVEWSKG